MSRKHPTTEELRLKAAHVEAERAKTSRFRPKVDRENPGEVVHLPMGDANVEPGTVQRDTRGELIGEDRPVQRLLQVPYSWLVDKLQKTHDLRGPCARETCAFKNTTPEDLEKARQLEGMKMEGTERK
jgi:hypothetical protein